VCHSQMVQLMSMVVMSMAAVCCHSEIAAAALL
jgi:hypothetical protein